MELLNTQYAETTYDIRLTESELGTILVALGNINYFQLLECNSSYEPPYKVINNPDQLDDFTDNLAKLVP